MKIQIDTTSKLIKVESKVKFDELIDSLNKLFPNEEWKNYELETNCIINWTYPVIVNPTTPYPYWQRPYYNDYQTTCQQYQQPGIFSFDVTKWVFLTT